ncbi:MAG: hypothetical protein HKO59_17345, partial [Phycisphaerales bacterium]|nr:hypothetical protein [Phycisphaerae bacterium]NNM27714.1 hypothetical protein [Phycisphaerales bacterium]
MANARIIVWARRGQESLVDDALRAGNLAIAGVGAPTVADATALGSHWDRPATSDIRQTARETDAAAWWIAAPCVLGGDERGALAERGCPVFTSEPRPIAFDELLTGDASSLDTAFVPLFRRSAGYRGTLDAVEAFGPAPSMSVVVAGGPGDGSLFARLYDAMDTLVTLGGTVERLDAALGGETTATPDRLVDLTGSMTVSLRFTGGRSGTAHVSNQTGGWFRRLTLAGEAGILSIGDNGYAWHRGDAGGPETGGEGAPG